MPLPLIPQDKANHAVYGAAIAAALASLAIVFSAPPWLAGLVGLNGALAAGWLKERLDGRANAKAAAAGEPLPHSVEKQDLLATVLGGALVAVPLGFSGAARGWMTALAAGVLP